MKDELKTDSGRLTDIIYNFGANNRVMKICFASNNAKKLDEISYKLRNTGLEIISPAEAGITEDIPETGDTLQANALQKARYVFDKTGLFCFADDTGLLVNALNGAPGVYSARYAGEQRSAEDNMNKLLRELHGSADRSACFKTVIALIHPTGEYLFEGEIRGTISEEKRGEKGFGYDPIFVPEGYTQTFAEMPAEVKNTISHRALAVDKLIAFLSR